MDKFQLIGKFTVELVKPNGQHIKLGEAENIVSNQGINELLAIRKINNNMVTQELKPNDIVELIL